MDTSSTYNNAPNVQKYLDILVGLRESEELFQLNHRGRNGAKLFFPNEEEEGLILRKKEECMASYRESLEVELQRSMNKSDTLRGFYNREHRYNFDCEYKQNVVSPSIEYFPHKTGDRGRIIDALVEDLVAWATKEYLAERIKSFESGQLKGEIIRKGIEITQRVLALYWFYLIDAGCKSSFDKHSGGVRGGYAEAVKGYGFSMDAFRNAYRKVCRREERIKNTKGNIANIKDVIGLLSDYPKARQVAEKDLDTISGKKK